MFLSTVISFVRRLYELEREGEVNGDYKSKRLLLSDLFGPRSIPFSSI